ncbi:MULTISPECIES: hypothetical protein [unclassified Pseudomonas]|uniref:hypothetical protein n=1 Tax=unclassified Pseudomonas TaxID=196821 RepID=UPI001CBF60F3|nr:MULTISPECIES: hypothetical protein [unclassified Pseudomonas]
MNASRPGGKYSQSCQGSAPTLLYIEAIARHPLTADLASKTGEQHGIIEKQKYDETPCACDPEPAVAKHSNH